MRVYNFKWHTNQYLVHQRAQQRLDRPVTEVTFDFHRDDYYSDIGKPINQANWAAVSLAKGYVGTVHFVRPPWFGEVMSEEGFPGCVGLVLTQLPQISGPITASLCFDYLSHCGTSSGLIGGKVGVHFPDQVEIGRNLAEIIAWLSANRGQVDSFSLVESPGYVFPEHVPAIKDAFWGSVRSSALPFVFEDWENDYQTLPPPQFGRAELSELHGYCLGQGWDGQT